MTKNTWIIIIFLLLIGIGFILTNLPNNNNQPILTLSTSESTTVYKITYYKDYAVYTNTTSGFSGPIENAHKTIQYNEKVNFKQLIEDIKNIPQNEHTISNQTNITKVNISVSGKNYSATRDNSVVVKLLDIVDIKFLNMSDLLK